MTKEIPFATAVTASEVLGRRYAQHLARKGATMMGYTQSEEQKLTGLFREKVQEAWQRKNDYELTPEQLDLLEESFSRNFGVTLGTLARV